MPAFLDRSRDLLTSGKVKDVRDKFEVVFKGIEALQRVHSKADIDIHNVESVFSAFEMAKLLGTFGAFSEAQLRDLLDAMPTVIARTVEESMMLSVETKGEFSRVLPPDVYRRFGEEIRPILAGDRPERSVTVGTPRDAPAYTDTQCSKLRVSSDGITVGRLPT